MKKLMVSPMTNKIYLTNARQDKKNPELFIATGEPQDYTDEAIRAVFEWFMFNYKKNEPKKAFQIKFENIPYVLTMTMENSQKE